VFRVIVGGLLMIEGWPKIIAPMTQVGFGRGSDRVAFRRCAVLGVTHSTVFRRIGAF
jgi:hypothetical protein